MAKLNWNDFDGNQFQKFCNSILLFTISKFTSVYTALGSDGGVDQLYEGSHDSKRGKWRFQDKFHNSGKKSSDISALKREILLDIENNYTEENFIVFLTNVNLTTTKHKELLDAAENQFKKLDINNCEFIIWHESTLEGLLSNYPIIYNWFWEKDSILLQTYEQYFSSQLREDIYEFRNQLKNKFFGREKQLSELSDFVEDSTKSSLAIISNGGYGKTRLIIEFLKNEISKKENWIPLVMSHTGFSPSNFSHLLKTERKLIIFIDNAHEIPDVVSEVKRQIDNTHGKDKLIITTRPTLFSEMFQKIPSHAKNIEKLLLRKLSYEQTKEMIKSELPELSEKNIIYLAEISKGVPNVVLELIRLIRLGKQPNEIAAEEVFNESVKEIFYEAINDIEVKTLISKEKANDFIRLIALISPVNNDDVNRTFIQELLELRKDKLELLINVLKDLHLLEAGQTISIRPDPYSDAILVETIKKNKSFIEHVRNFSGAEKYLENILKNLAEAEISKDEKEHFIEGLLHGYISLLGKPETSNEKIKSILQLVEKIAVYKPDHAISAVKHSLLFFTNRDHSMYSEIDIWKNKPFYNEFGELIANIITALCTYSKYAKDNKEEIHRLIEEYISETGNLNIIASCYNYHEWDFSHFRYRPRECCEKQIFLKNIVCRYLSSDTETSKLSIALTAAEILLALEFQLERFFEEATMKMYFGEGPIPYCEHIEKLRIGIIMAIIEFITNTQNEELKEKALDLLMNYFFYSCKNCSKRYRQDLTKEINIVLPYLNTFLDDTPTIHQKNKILGYIQRFGKSGFKEEFEETINILKEKSSSTNTLYEALEMQMINSDYFDVRNNMETRINYLTYQYGSLQEFETDLIKIRLGIGKTDTQFPTILSIIGKNHPNEAREIFARMQKNNPALISESTALIRDQYKDEEYFYGILDWLWERKDIHIATFFWLLSWGRNRDIEFYKDSDLDYYEYAINNPTSFQADDTISYNLIAYAYINKDRTFHLLDKFIKTSQKRNLDHLNYIIFDNKEKYSDDFKNEIKNLFYNNIDKINFENSHGEMFFEFIERKFGFDELFSFLHRLFKALSQKDKYAYLNLDRYYYTSNPSLPDRISKFAKVLDWYIVNHESNPKESDFILNFFRPDIKLTEEIKIAIIPMINNHRSDSKALLLIAQSLQKFTNKDKEWISTLCLIADHVTLSENRELDFSKIFGSSFYYNSGSKSKVGRGIPYNEDVEKKSLLEKIISEKEYNNSVINYLSKCLSKVNQDMEQTIQEDEENSSW